MLRDKLSIIEIKGDTNDDGPWDTTEPEQEPGQEHAGDSSSPSLARLLEGLPDDDRVRLVFHSSYLNYPIALPFLPVKEWTKP